MKKYRHIFFDLDHTLWDFETNSRATLVNLFQKHELDRAFGCDQDHFYRRYIAVNDQKWALYRHGKLTKEELRAQRFYDTFDSLGWCDADFCAGFEKEYLDLCPRQTALLPGAVELLDYLKENYILHIITNGFVETQSIKIRESGLEPYFTQVVSSEEIGINKPNARIFVESLKRAGATRKDSLMIGDNLEADVLGAKNCGIDHVYFNPRKQAHAEKITYEIRELAELHNIL